MPRPSLDEIFGAAPKRPSLDEIFGSTPEVREPGVVDKVSAALNIPDLVETAKGLAAPFTEWLPALGEDIAAATHDPVEVYNRYKQGVKEINPAQVASDTANFFLNPVGLSVEGLVDSPIKAIADISGNFVRNWTERPWSTATNTAMLAGGLRSGRPAKQKVPARSPKDAAEYAGRAEEGPRPVERPPLSEIFGERGAHEKRIAEAELATLREQGGVNAPLDLSTPEAIDAFLRDNPKYRPPLSEILDEKPATAAQEARTDTNAPKPGIDVLRTELDAVVKDIEGEASLPVGLSTRKAGRGRSDKIIGIDDSPVKFGDAEAEARYQISKQGVQKEPLIDKVKANITKLGHSFSRTFPELKRNAENAQLNYDLIKLKKSRDMVQDMSARMLNGITAEFGPRKMDLFTRKVFMQDLLESSERGQPNAYFPDTTAIRTELGKIDAIASQNPDILKAVESHRRYMNALADEYTKWSKEAGYALDDVFTYDNYFRHQVLDFANAKRAVSQGTGNRLRQPVGKSYTKERVGTEDRLHNANYFEATFEVSAGMLHDINLNKVIAKTLKPKSEQIISEAKTQARALGIDNWKDLIDTDKYGFWQPREGSHFYQAHTVPEGVAQSILEGAGKEIGITADALGSALARGGAFKELVLPVEWVETLNNMHVKPHGTIARLASAPATAWKVLVLTAPRRFFKYNVRNITGDMEGAFLSNPAVFKEVLTAIKELYQAFYGKVVPPMVKRWGGEGGFQSTLQIQELSDINNLHIFERFKGYADKPEGVAGKAVKPFKRAWSAYWTVARKATDFREAVLRYAAFRHYIKELEANGGRVKNYGASIRDEINNLATNEQKAFKLSNDMLGAYDDISVAGQVLRSFPWPFWSWKEANFRRFKRTVENAYIDGKTAQVMARKLGYAGLVKTPAMAIKLGKVALKMSAVTAMLQAWNRTMYPEQEDALDKFNKNRPHIILGTDADGKTRYFSGVGAVGDIVDWIGADATVGDVNDYMDGKTSFKELMFNIAKNAVEAPVNIAAQGISPFIKAPAEIATGKTTFPDVFNPRNIHEPGRYAAQQLTVGPEYDALTNRPGPGYKQSISDLAVYRQDPDEAAYFATHELTREYNERKGKEISPGVYKSPKTRALYMYRLAVKYKEPLDRQTELLQEYKDNGGTERGLRKSFDMMEPTRGISKAEKEDFMASLTPKERKKVERARQYYERVIRPSDSELKWAWRRTR